MQLPDALGDGGDGLGFGPAVLRALALEDIQPFFQIRGVDQVGKKELARREPILVLPALRERLFGLR